MDDWLLANGIDPADVDQDHPVMIVADDIILYRVKTTDGGYEEQTTWCHFRPPDELGVIEI